MRNVMGFVLGPLLWVVGRVFEPLLFLVLTFAYGGFLLNLYGSTAATGGLFLFGLAVLSIVFDVVFGRR